MLCTLSRTIELGEVQTRLSTRFWTSVVFWGLREEAMIVSLTLGLESYGWCLVYDAAPTCPASPCSLTANPSWKSTNCIRRLKGLPCWWQISCMLTLKNEAPVAVNSTMKRGWHQLSLFSLTAHGPSVGVSSQCHLDWAWKTVWRGSCR